MVIAAATITLMVVDSITRDIEMALTAETTIAEGTTSTVKVVLPPHPTNSLLLCFILRVHNFSWQAKASVYRALR